MERRTRIVVGVDGSEHSHRALEWAIREAARWGATVTVLHAWRFGVSPTDPNAAEATREIGRAAQHLVDHEVAFACEAGIDAAGVVVFDGAARALTDAAADADLLVVGSHGRGAVAATILGSVSQACVRHARCPVVVVPDTAAVTVDGTDQRTVSAGR